MSEPSAILIDANQYLLLYGTVSGRKLLKPLSELRQHIFVSEQIVNEVNRNKLDVAARFFCEQFKSLCVNQVGVPDHLFGVDDEELRSIRQDVDSLGGTANEIACRPCRSRRQAFSANVLMGLGGGRLWQAKKKVRSMAWSWPGPGSLPSYLPRGGFIRNRCNCRMARNLTGRHSAS